VNLTVLIYRQDQDVVSCSVIPGNRIASGSISGMIFVHSIESSVLIMKWHIDDVMFGYGEGLRMDCRSEAELSPTQVRSLKPVEFAINRNKILADKARLSESYNFTRCNDSAPDPGYSICRQPKS
jgi:hypothetical protein